MDQLFTVRMLSEKTITKNKRMILVYVDLEKGSLNWTTLELFTYAHWPS